MSFDAFGKRRDADWRSALDFDTLIALNAMHRRGFTAHEHLDAHDVVHMNGRIYDPELGRFLQADPLVQSPTDTQSLNRYIYAGNNPLSYTDPSGYFSVKRFVKRWGRLIAGVAVSLVLPGSQGVLASFLNVSNIYAQAAITGFIAGGIISGTFKGAVVGSITAVAVAGLVQAFTPGQTGAPLAPDKELMPSEDTVKHLYRAGWAEEGLVSHYC